MRERTHIILILTIAFIMLADIVLADDQYSRRKAVPFVLISTEEGTFDIKPSSGEFKKVTLPFVGYRRFVEFPTTATAMLIKQPDPVFLLKMDGNPRDEWWLVKLKYWEDNKVLVVDLLSPSSWAGGATSDDPDDTCNIQYSAINNKQGHWQITPKNKLQPGEYGLFRWMTRNSSTALLYGFTVDDNTPPQTPANSAAVSATPTDMYKNVKGIRLKNGKVIQGQIISVENDMVKIRTKDNKIASYHFIKDVREFVMK